MRVYTGEKPVSYVTRLGEAPIKRSATYEKHEVSIQNSRSIGKNAPLDRGGFLFTHHISNVVDFYDRAEASKHCYREIESLVMGATGGNRVHVFDHNVRADLEAKRK